MTPWFKNPLLTRLFITVGSKGFKPVSCLFSVPCLVGDDGKIIVCLDTKEDIERALKATGQGEELFENFMELIKSMAKREVGVP